MSRNIKSNFKSYNTSYMKTISKQTVDTQYDIDVSSFQTSNNISKKNNIKKTNIYTYANNNNSNRRYSNYKVRIKNNSFKKFALINNNNSKSKHKNNLYLFNNNTLNNNSHSFSKFKKKIKSKTKDKISVNNTLNIKSTSNNKIKTEINSLNISKNTKIKNKKENNNLNKEPNNFLLKKSNTSKLFQIKIKNCHNNLKATKIGNNIINNYSTNTNINSPIGSDREEKQIISLNHELTNKKNEINKLKERINEQNKYITELEEKIKSIIDEKKKEDIDYEQYSKKMIVRNIKVLTTENEELHKQIDEYKGKQMKIMKALYYLKKQGISIDSFLENQNNENKS